MKIFYTKKDKEEMDYLRKVVKEQNRNLETSYGQVKILRKENKELHEFSKHLQKENAKITKINEELFSKMKSYRGRCGGLTKQNNKLKKENEELKAGLKNEKKKR